MPLLFRNKSGSFLDRIVAYGVVVGPRYSTLNTAQSEICIKRKVSGGKHKKIHYSFLNLGETSEMHRQLRLHPVLVNRKSSILLEDNGTLYITTL